MLRNPPKDGPKVIAKIGYQLLPSPYKSTTIQKCEPSLWMMIKLFLVFSRLWVLALAFNEAPWLSTWFLPPRASSWTLIVLMEQLFAAFFCARDWSLWVEQWEAPYSWHPQGPWESQRAICQSVCPEAISTELSPRMCSSRRARPLSDISSGCWRSARTTRQIRYSLGRWTGRPCNRSSRRPWGNLRRLIHQKLRVYR